MNATFNQELNQLSQSMTACFSKEFHTECMESSKLSLEIYGSLIIKDQPFLDVIFQLKKIKIHIDNIIFLNNQQIGILSNNNDNLILLSNWIECFDINDGLIVDDFKKALWDFYYNDRSTIQSHIQETFGIPSELFNEFFKDIVNAFSNENFIKIKFESAYSMLSSKYHRDWLLSISAT